MIARRQQVAVAVAGILTAAAACQAQHHTSKASGRPAPPAAHGFTLVAAGGILPHSSVLDRARFDAGGTGYDFRPMLAAVRPLVSHADLALCHIETVYGDSTGAVPLAAPPEEAQGLAATGYDSCSTASGHSLDEGTVGIQRTLDALDRAGVRHTGTARTDAEARTVALLRAGPAKVAHLDYTADTNGVPLPPAEPWAVNLLDPARVLADARAARRAGADVVVVSLRWGTTGQAAPDPQEVALAGELTAARTDGRPDIDLILGTDAHTPQPYEKVNGTWVVYGLGDQITGAMYDNAGTQDPGGNLSTVGRFTFVPPARPGGRWEVAKAEFVPHLFDIDAGRVVDVGQAIGQGADLTGDRDRIREAVLSRGAAKDGLVMGK
ncbi:CapA family protein [Streptomyces prunicolor]|uniref:CapA family protein n=1 Tax=Streptomyces prunicolor TaxID=67348 RepID=UPI00224DD3B7|nr:CapA family protein [Streptomyces prunicolor]MCX5239922.1 CapA family protein [Streptomyces prunicolor]